MEERRGARVATTFLVAIEDLEQVPVPRQGDISQTGVYFETSAEVGAAGTIHWLQLVSVDRIRHVRVMACVVRTAARGRLRGAAFEFMPESDESVTALQSFVKYALGLRVSTASLPQVTARLEAEASRRGPLVGTRPAIVGKLSVRSMVLETSWAVEPGESLRVEIAAPGMTRRIRLEGTAVRVAPNDTVGRPSTYTIEVEVHEETERPLAHSSMSFAKVVPPAPLGDAAVTEPSVTEEEIVVDESLRTLDELLSALIVPPGDDARKKRAHHLAGQISSVPLTTLLSLFEMERMSGELVLRRDAEVVRLYFDGGRVVDVAPVGPNEKPRDRVRVVLGWREGAFEFDVKGVQREDRIQTSTTALLLDLAREDDEAGRDKAG